MRGGEGIGTALLLGLALLCCFRLTAGSPNTPTNARLSLACALLDTGEPYSHVHAAGATYGWLLTPPTDR